MPEDRGAAKARQREAARARRRGMPPAARDKAVAAITGRVLAELAAAGPFHGLLLGYGATTEEVDLTGLLDHLLASGREVALPRVAGPGRLALHQVRDLRADVRPGAMGIPEPRPDLPRVAPSSIGVALVPGVAFDRAGGRIGYGGGYFDRLLPLLSGIPTLGICFEVQLVAHVVREPHDVDVGAVLTEDAVYRWPPSPAP